MKTRLLLVLIISTLLLSSGSSLLMPVYSETGSSTSFQIDGSNIKSVGETKSSTSFSVDDQVTDIGSTGTSTSFTTEPPLNPTNDCGNGTKEFSEECDTSDFGAASCSDYGFNTGTLTCSSSCTIETTSCSNTSGETGEVGGGIIPKRFLNQNEDDEDGEEENEQEPQEPDEEQEPPTPQEAVIPSEEESQTTPTPKVFIAKEPELKKPEEALPKIDDDDFHIKKDKIQVSDLPTPIRPPQPVLPTDPGIKQTIDKTPVISGKLRNNQTYTVQIYDQDNNLISEENVTTNDQGIFIYEPSTTLDLGLTLFKIIDAETKTSKPFSTYSIEIIPEDYQDLEITTFGDKTDVPKDISEPVDLGAIIKQDGALLITGLATPNSTIYAYFQTKIIIEQSKVDQNGYFEIAIPSSLSLGDHKVTLIQVYQDKTISNDLVYLFKLILPPNYEYKKNQSIEPKDLLTQSEHSSTNIIYTILSIFVVVLILATYHLSMRKYSNKRNKKTKPLKPKKK